MTASTPGPPAAKVKPHLFDCNCALGHRIVGSACSFLTPDDLIRELDRVGIDEALVYHTDALECDPATGNQSLLTMIADHPRLHPAWVAAPETPRLHGGADAFFSDMLRAGVGMIRIFPKDLNHVMQPWVYEDLFDLAAARRVPVLVDNNPGHWLQPAADWRALHDICTRWPELRLVLAHVSIGSPRDLYPLLAKHPHLYFETSYFQPQDGLRFVASHFGIERILFGTGMPVYDCSPPLAMLAGSDLDQRERAQVGADNLRRLLEGCR